MTASTFEHRHFLNRNSRAVRCQVCRCCSCTKSAEFREGRV